MQHQFCMFDENRMMGPAGEGSSKRPVEWAAYGVGRGRHSQLVGVLEGPGLHKTAGLQGWL